MSILHTLRDLITAAPGTSRRRRATVAAAGAGLPQPFIADATIGESPEDQALRIMVNEVTDLTKAMRELLMTADRFIYFAGIVAAAALTLGVMRHDEGNNGIILIFAPYGIAVAFGYLVQVYTEVEKRAGYKEYLESKVNQMMPSPILLESHVNSRSARNRLSVIGMQVLNFAGFAALILLSWRETWDRYGGDGHLHLMNLHTANAVFLCLATLVLVGAVYENRVASKRAREAAEEAYATLVKQARRKPQ